MNITSKILDGKSKQPLANVNIRVNDVIKTNTDANGNFTLTGVKESDIIEPTFIGYSPFFSLASDFPKTVYLDSGGYALNEVVIKNVFKKTNWLMWLGLGVGVTALYAYKKNSDSKKVVKAKI